MRLPQRRAARVILALRGREMCGTDLEAEGDWKTQRGTNTGVYRTLHLLKEQGLVRVTRTVSEGARPRRYYRLTAAGRAMARKLQPARAKAR